MAGGGLGHVNSQITNDGYRYMSIGRTPTLQPFDNGGVYVRQSWTSGVLKGFSANLGMTYTGPSHPDSFNAGDTYALDPVTKKEVFVRSTDQWATKIPSYVLFQGGIRYILPHRPGAGYTHQLGLNVNNIADKFYIASIRSVGDRRNFYLSYTLRH